MMALRSPGMILSVTSRTARRPPKLFESARSSRTGLAAVRVRLAIHLDVLADRE